MRGQLVCVKHGGNSPQARRAAERRIEEERVSEAAASAVRRLGLPLDVDPTQALLDELHQTAGIVAWLREEIDTSGMERIENIVDTAAWRTWQEQRTHLARVAAECIRAGIAERAVRIAEQQAGQVVAAMRAAMAAVGVDPASVEAVEAVTSALRALG